MSDVHRRQVEAGVSLTFLVAKRVMQELEGEDKDNAVEKLKKTMEGYIEEEENFKIGGKVLMEMRKRLGKVSGGDWPNVEKEYKELVDREKRKFVVEEHSWWKKLTEVLNKEYGTLEDNDGSDDDELEMTQVERNTLCPVSRREMVKPVKNILCGHVYDMNSIESLLKQNPMNRCPLVGCPNKTALLRSNLREDKETKRAIIMNRA